MIRLYASVLAAACCLAAFSSIAVAADSKRPNVIVILADDQGWGDVSLHDNPNLSTPNIDALAREGAQVKNFYVCAVCSPTRAEFLTGRYHTRMGVYSTSAGGERFDASERTIGDVFKDAGYATAAYGKWHSGMQYPYHPNARGFDEYYGFCSGHWGNYYDPMLEHNGEIVKGKGFIIDDLTNHAIDFTSPHRDESFFIYLPLNTPHSPMQVPQPYWDRFKDKEIVPDPDSKNSKRENLDHTRAALAMCENIDDNVGRLVSHLKETGLDQDTIVIYFSDNGPNGSRFNGGLKGRKGSTNEGGLRSVFAMRYPRMIQAGTVVNRVAGAIDLLPTLASFAGIEWHSGQVNGKPIDGISLTAELTNNQLGSVQEDRVLYSHWKGRHTVRTERYRMHSSGELYDIQNDPNEKSNLAAQQPDVANALRGELAKFVPSDSGADQDETRPFPIAHPEALWTQLPARDATFSGQITRSNRFPNCTYLLNWNDKESVIRWDVDAISSGRYQVQMYYCCPKEDVGSTIQLSLGDEVLTAKIDQPVESPLIGEEEDRVKRMEGYVRWWKPTTLGEINVRPGRQSLELRATDIPGSQVAEMRLLMLKKLD